MSKGRKRSKAKSAAKAAKAAAKAAGFEMPPGPRPLFPGGFCGGRPPLARPMMPGNRFPMGPPDFRPPMMDGGPFMKEPPDFGMRDQHVHRPGFDMHPRFVHPDMEDGPRGFHPEPHEGRPSGFVPSEFRDGPPGFVPPEFRDRPPEFRDRPPDFVPHEFRDRPPDFVPPAFRDGPQEFRDRHSDFVPPEFRDRPPHFVPPDFRDRPQGFAPPEFRDRPRDFPPTEFRDGTSDFVPPAFGYGSQGFGPPAGIRQFEDGPGCHAVDPSCMHPQNAPSNAPCPPQQPSEPATEQSSASVSNENSTNSTTNTTTSASTSNKEISVVKKMLGSVKPPPGRSLGVITFISNSYGFIERDDLKKYSFSFDAFFGKRIHLVPGVKVHFTAVQELGKEFATDVKVAPRGTEEIGDTVYEGVVIAVLPETYVLEPHPGRIRSILTTEPVKLPFGKMDSKATLLLFDRVKFQLVKDIISKVRRATNITPQMPETIQLTKETREKGVIMSITPDTFTIKSKTHENLTASLNENFSHDQLKVMDEVEFTLVTAKDKMKAIRLMKLPEQPVELNSQAKNVTDSSAGKSLWKPVNSVVAAGDEDISNEKYDGTISQIIPKSSEKEMEQELPRGIVDTVVNGKQKRLPFGPGDVITQATMMVGDKVQFNIATKQQTKGQHAINIEIRLETFQRESKEQRKIGIVVKLDANSGFIKAPQNPQVCFNLSEVMDDVKLSLLEKVEFTLAAGPDEAADSKRAIRIRRLTESVFTSVPKVEEKKEKKKMTIKLLKDLKESIKTHVKTEGEDSDLLDAEKPKSIKEDNKGKDENSNKGNGERSRSRESSRRSRSRSQDKSGSYHGKHRSSSRDRSHRSYRRSRSRSRDRSRRYRRSYSHSRSRSRSRERSNRSGRKRTCSPENTHEHRKGQSQECSSSKRSKSPDDKIKTSKYAASTPSMESVNNELAMKRNELLELNELIARKKAIIAMEQNSKTPSQFKDTLYTDTEINTQHGIATFDYQHKTYQENPWTPDMKPVRSILKKHSESLSNSQNQEIERSESIEEPEGCAQTNTSSMYTSAGSVPVWSSTAEIEDLELARKKRQLEELSESIARKRAIIAMEQKAKALSDGSEIKKKYDFGSCSDDLNITMASKNTWQLDIKPDLQPKKSILKKRTETVPDQPQKDLTSAGQYGHFPLFKQPEDDSSAFLNPSGPLDTAFKKTPSVLSPGDLFKKLLTGASISSCTSSNKAIVQQPLQPSLGLFYSQKCTRETKEQSYPASLSQFSHQDYEEASTSEGSSTQSSASNRKSNLATQMERFLGALNKADSNLLSSLLRDAKKDSDLLENQRISHEQAARKAACDELYDPFKETDCNENSYTSPNTHDDLLPHERVVEDGSGFSKIVGMKYGSEAMPEDRYLYGEPIPSISQSRLLEEHEKFLKECDQFKSSQGRFSDETYFEESYAEDKRKKTSGRYRIEGSRSPARPKSVDANEDAAQKASHYKAIQDLLQTVGLNLDTSEVSKLDDRTKERLYGKKVKSQSSRSSDRKDGQSVSRFDKRDRSQSTDSDSVSPAKSSKREVYMSYMDSIKYRKDEAEELNLLSLKRTIRNSPEAEQQTSDPQQIAPAGVTHDPYKPIAETFSAGLPYPQMASEFSSAAHQESQQCSYAVGRQENPYGPVYYPAAYSTPPPGYQGYGASVMPLPIMPPNPSQFYPSFSSFSTPGPFGPSYYPPSLNLNGMSMQPGSSSYAPQQVKTKPTSQSRCLKTIETVKTERSVSVKLSASKEVRTVISIQTENEPKDTKDEPEMATMKEDDIKAKQKKRLEQFNQRMRLKKKQQMEAQRTRGLNQKSSPGTVMRTEVKNVWICGHSLVFWAEKRATSPEIGMQLGMDPNSVRIWWKGVQGMTWQQLLPQLLQLKDNWPNPDMILIHLGGNDIGKMTPETFVLAVKKDMISLKSIFPQCRLVWSDILPRKSWRHSDDSTNVNNMRQAINKTIHGIMLELGGVSLTHDNIMSTQDPGLYRPDGVHLSGKGIDTFNLNMQDLLERWESEICETEASES